MGVTGSEAPRVGVVGLGVMGTAIARRLLSSLGTVAVCDLRPEAVAALAAEGARTASSPSHLASTCDVVILSLNTADVVRAVVLGPDGLAEGVRAAAPGLLVVDMSSIDPESTRRLAAECAPHGIRWVDAPLSGGAPGAAAGQLTLMLGGDKRDVAEAGGVLGHLAGRMTHLGGVGAGQVGKLVNQVLVGAGFGALAEAAALVRAEGLSAEEVLSALTGGRADSALLQEFFAKFVHGDLTPTGRVANMVKDLETARDHARTRAVPLPLTSLVSELNRWLVSRGLGDADNAVIMGYYDAALLPVPVDAGGMQ